MMRWLFVFLFSCLITEPPGNVAPASPKRPAIIHDTLFPPISMPIVSITPGENFTAQIDADPQSPFDWELVLDQGMQDEVTEYGPITEPADPNLQFPRSISRPLEGIFDASRCQTLTLTVGLAPFFKHQPANPPGGDIAVWFYRPNGSQGACPGVDAGTAPDVGAPPSDGGE